MWRDAAIWQEDPGARTRGADVANSSKSIFSLGKSGQRAGMLDSHGLAGTWK